MPSKPFDLALLGATGATGRQAVRALRRQAAAQGLRVLLAGRDPAALAALAGSGDTAFGTLGVDGHDPESLDRLAARSAVLLNFAGPYAEFGDAVVAACIAHGTHHLDLSGETFWVRRLVEQRHAPAQRAGVKLVPACGYEVLPFDLATHAAAHELLRRHGQRLAQVRLRVRFTGQRLARAGDAVSAGTVASLRSLLKHDDTDSARNVACLLPPGHPRAEVIAQRNAPVMWPRYDAEAQAVLAPTLPAPWVTPPLVLRGVALAGDAAPFAPDFQYAEATDMRGLLPDIDLPGWAERATAGWPAAWPAGWPGRDTVGQAAGLLRDAAQRSGDAASLAAQWSAAAAFTAPLAAVAAALASPVRGAGGLPREALERLVAAVSARTGDGPRESVLDAMGYDIAIHADGDGGARLQGVLHAHGHPSVRSTPEMAVAAAVGLARGTLGRHTPCGVVPPALALGDGALEAMAAAGVSLQWAA